MCHPMQVRHVHTDMPHWRLSHHLLRMGKVGATFFLSVGYAHLGCMKCFILLSTGLCLCSVTPHIGCLVALG